MSSKEVVLAFLDAMKTNDFAKASEWLSQILKGFGLNLVSLLLDETTSQQSTLIIQPMVLGSSSFIQSSVMAKQ